MPRSGSSVASSTYKTAWYGTDLVIADRWFPSSQDVLGLRHREGRPDAVRPGLPLRPEHGGCGLAIDRDLNAAINLARYQPGEDTKTSPPLAAAA